MQYRVKTLKPNVTLPDGRTYPVSIKARVLLSINTLTVGGIAVPNA